MYIAVSHVALSKGLLPKMCVLVLISNRCVSSANYGWLVRYFLYFCITMSPHAISTWLCNVGHISEAFIGEMRLDKLNFDPKTYGNPNSPEYKQLAGDLCNRVSSISLITSDRSMGSISGVQC